MQGNASIFQILEVYNGNCLACNQTNHSTMINEFRKVDLFKELLIEFY